MDSPNTPRNIFFFCLFLSFNLLPSWTVLPTQWAPEPSRKHMEWPAVITVLQNPSYLCNTWNRFATGISFQNQECTASSYSLPTRNIILHFCSTVNSWKEIIASWARCKPPEAQCAFLTMGMRKSPVTFDKLRSKSMSEVPSFIKATAGMSQCSHKNTTGDITGGHTHGQCWILALHEQFLPLFVQPPPFQLSFCQCLDSNRYFSNAPAAPGMAQRTGIHTTVPPCISSFLESQHGLGLGLKGP